MTDKTVLELIIEALEEASYLEMGMEVRDESRMLYHAQKLSGAPFSFVKEVYQKYT